MMPNVKGLYIVWYLKNFSSTNFPLLDKDIGFKTFSKAPILYKANVVGRHFDRMTYIYINKLSTFILSNRAPTSISQIGKVTTPMNVPIKRI
jgi:hypothetical protein